MNDREKFAVMTGCIRTIAEEMLTEFFGEQCGDFEPECDCCGIGWMN